MAQRIECIPNISEGRDRIKIRQMAESIESTRGVSLLNIDSNEAANRTVFTFVGETECVFRAAAKLVSKAGELIDMSMHTGEHPRIGAVDVCPFVPISGITTDELTALAETFARETAEQNGIAVYLYEYNAHMPQRRRLEQIRTGEYEGLAAKMDAEGWAPDFGTARFNPRFGAMVCGTRDYLIAFNINLNTKDKALAKSIAAKIRHSGRTETINGNKHIVAGIFANLKAIGWYISDFGCAQVSTNITNMRTAPIHEVFETVKRLAQDAGADSAGSELIGLVPFGAMHEAGKYYAPAKSSREQIFAAIEAMGLGSVKIFDPNERILEIKAGWMERL